MSDENNLDDSIDMVGGIYRPTILDHRTRPYVGPIHEFRNDEILVIPGSNNRLVMIDPYTPSFPALPTGPEFEGWQCSLPSVYRPQFIIGGDLCRDPKQALEELIQDLAKEFNVDLGSKDKCQTKRSSKKKSQKKRRRM